MFLAGDILLKIDARARFLVPGFNTQHHALLVINTAENGHPLVAHMKFTNLEQKVGELVVEHCPPAKDLVLIRAPFSDSARREIHTIATQAKKSNQLKIEQTFLENEYHQSNNYRWEDGYEIEKKLRLLYQQPIQASNVISESPQLISCHDFVLSAIHLACNRTEHPIPPGLNIPPHLAWSDILNAACRADTTLSFFDISRIRLYNSTGTINCDASFFDSRTKKTQLISAIDNTEAPKNKIEQNFECSIM